MPKIFEQDGFSFFFYMNEHAPIHAHVSKGGKKAKFEIGAESVRLVSNGGLGGKDVRRAETLAFEHRAEIVAKWREIFGKEV